MAKLSKEERIQAAELSTLIGTVLGSFIGLGTPLRVVDLVLEYWAPDGAARTQLQELPAKLAAARAQEPEEPEEPVEESN